MKIAETPPMGWNSWDCYGAAVTEAQLMKNAEYMAKNLLSHGWEYVICDIQWYEPNARSTEYNRFAQLAMDGYSRLIPAENRFPSSCGGKGFSVISDRLHAMGLKFGIHIMRGIPRQAAHARCRIMGSELTADMIADPFSICSWNSDMYGVDPLSDGASAYYDSLFALYAEWGVDYVKIDDIACIKAKPHDPFCAEAELRLIDKAVKKCGRDMVISLSPGPAPTEKAEQLKQLSNMWRMTDDVWDHWETILDMFSRCEQWYQHTAAGAWPDCDMLPFGHINVNDSKNDHYTRLTHDEQISMMTLWSIFRSPLILGAELSDCDKFTLSLLTNDEVLRLNKHSHGAHPICRDDSFCAWLSYDDDAGVYVAMFNLSNSKKAFSLPLEVLESGDVCSVRDLWKLKDLGTASKKLERTIPPHGACLLRLKEI